MLTQKICRILAVLGMIFGLMGTALASTETLPLIQLRVGQRYPIEGVLAESAKIEPGNIAKVHQTPEGLMLVGALPGSATLTLVASGKNVKVRLVVSEATAGEANPRPWNQVLGELRSTAGLSLSTLGNKTILQGEILSRRAYQRVLLHMRNYPANLVVLATPAPGIKASLIEQSHSFLASRGLSKVEVSNAGNRFFLEGSVDSPEQVEQAFETVQAVLPNIENHLAIPIRVEPTISMRVFLLELSRQAHFALGLNWPSATRAAAVFTPSSALFEPTWAVTLQHLSNQGQARILAEPMLAVKSGSQAELSAGGEIPIKITGLYENKVVWRHYGLKIRIAIAGTAGKHIRTKIDTESSQLDEATAVDGVPGLRSSNMATEVDVLEGEPILLTGLFQAEAAKDVEKVPLLGNIPLIGELFKSRRFRDRETELLVALLPTFGATRATLPLASARGLEFDKRWRILD